VFVLSDGRVTQLVNQHMHRCIDPSLGVNTRIHIHTYINFVPFVYIKSYGPLGLVPAIHGREDNSAFDGLPAWIEVRICLNCPKEPFVPLFELGQKWRLIIEGDDRHANSEEENGDRPLHLLYADKI